MQALTLNLVSSLSIFVCLSHSFPWQILTDPVVILLAGFSTRNQPLTFASTFTGSVTVTKYKPLWWTWQTALTHYLISKVLIAQRSVMKDDFGTLFGTTVNWSLKFYWETKRQLKNAKSIVSLSVVKFCQGPNRDANCSTRKWSTSFGTFSSFENWVCKLCCKTACFSKLSFLLRRLQKYCLLVKRALYLDLSCGKIMQGHTSTFIVYAKVCDCFRR